MRPLPLRGSLALGVLGIATLLAAACVELKDPAAGALPPEAGVSPVDGGSSGGAADAGALAIGRRRLAAPPSRWFVSARYVYVASDESLQRIRASTDTVLDYAFPIDIGSPRPTISANDTHVVLQMHDRVALYDGSSSSHGVYTDLNKAVGSVALDSRCAWVRATTSPATFSVYVIDPAEESSPRVTSSVAALDAAIVGARGSDVFLHAKGSSELLVAHVDSATSSKWVLPSADVLRMEGVSGSTTEMVAAFGSPEEPTFMQLDAEGASRDLTAEVMAASSTIPAVTRKAVDATFAQFGKWFIYAAEAGLLAFDRIGKQLVPSQLPLSAGVRLRSPRVVEDDLLVFELFAGDASKEGPPGLYVVELTMLQ